MNRMILQFTAHLHIKNYAVNSVQNHRLDLQRFRSWLETQGEADLETLCRITPADLRRYQAELARGLKQRSINRHLSSIKLFFGFLEEGGLISENPMDSVRFPKTLPVLPNMLLPGEVDALLATPNEDHYLGLRDKALLELLYSTGLKLHELIALNVDDLELELSFLRVKGKRERMVPLTDRAKELLGRFLLETRASRLRTQDDPWVFPGRNGNRISRVGVWKLIKKYALQAGIKRNFNPRALRHAFAMHLILNGMDLDGIRVLYGYKQLEATTLYAHVNTPDFREIYETHHPSATDGAD